MTVDIKPIDPVNRSFFAGVVSGLDLRKPLSAEEVAGVHGRSNRPPATSPLPRTGA
jgi:hypothetical protein